MMFHLTETYFAGAAINRDSLNNDAYARNRIAGVERLVDETIARTPEDI